MRQIKIVSASILDAESKRKIENFFSEKGGEKPVFIYDTDEALIGGFMAVDGDNYYDATLKGQLNKLKRSGEADLVLKSEGAQGIAARIRKKIYAYKKDYGVISAGLVTYAGDGIIKIGGLTEVRNGELLELDNGARAIALNLEESSVGAIILDDESAVSAGSLVKSTGSIVGVPVGEQLLGRIVDPLGNPLDELGDFSVKKMRPIESHAPQITDRDKVNVPLQTGILAIDSMTPIGRGQRELIIGDRQTGKTAIAVDTILNQKDKGVYCVYVAIGQKSSTVSGIVNTLRERDALKYTAIVCSTAKDSAPLQYIAPYAGCAIAEEFMYAGKDVLIIYDDLTKHAVAYRAISLLLKRPPGREAYPGDIFYLHSRLLERAAKLSEHAGGGSMTALPIVETLAGDISAYIPTNVISITDGQIYLETELFNAGIRPAINVGLSVSRVGGSAQIKAMKKVSGKLRLDLSQYRELAVFAQFGSELDTVTQNLLAQGERTTETLKQDQFAPLGIEQQIVLLYVTMKEMLKDIPVKSVRRFNAGFLAYIDANYPNIIYSIQATKDISMDIGLQIEEAAGKYKEYAFKE